MDWCWKYVVDYLVMCWHIRDTCRGVMRQKRRQCEKPLLTWRREVERERQQTRRQGRTIRQEEDLRANFPRSPNLILILSRSKNGTNTVVDSVTIKNSSNYDVNLERNICLLHVHSEIRTAYDVHTFLIGAQTPLDRLARS